MLLLLTTAQEEKKEYKEMLEGLCEENARLDLPGFKACKYKLGFKIV